MPDRTAIRVHICDKCGHKEEYTEKIPVFTAICRNCGDTFQAAGDLPGHDTLCFKCYHKRKVAG